MKIFSTQLQGIFSKIAEQEELIIEDSARLLSQAISSDGTVYIHGFEEMEAISIEAIHGTEPLPSTKRLFENQRMAPLTELDRVLLISRFSTDEKTIALAEELAKKGIATVAISAVVKDSSNSLEQIVDFHIDSKLLKPLIPDDDGSRYGFPSIMTALFAYYNLAFTIRETIKEYQE